MKALYGRELLPLLAPLRLIFCHFIPKSLKKLFVVFA